jgi:hypothetical protein
MNTRFKVFASYNILQYLCDFIHVLIFITVSKCRKSPKLTNIVIIGLISCQLGARNNLCTPQRGVVNIGHRDEWVMLPGVQCGLAQLHALIGAHSRPDGSSQVTRPGVILVIRLPRDRLGLQQVNEILVREVAHVVISDPEGGSSDGGDVVGLGRVRDCVVQ